MPELPEVETVRIGLSVFLPGKRIKKIWHDWPKSFPNPPADVEKFLVGASVIDVQRRAKVLLIALSTKYSLVIHLKMTGQLVFQGKKGEHFGAGHPSQSLLGELPTKSTRVIFYFSDGSTLFFNDQRKFGWVRLLPTAEVPNIDFFKKLGPEPLAEDFNAGQFHKRLIRRLNSSIKAVLLDQTIIAGVGNIYADECLWGAKIHPATPVNKLTRQQINRLFVALQSILTLAIKKGGSTDRNYVNAEGKQGSYLSFAQVFRRQGKPCSRCGTVIIKIRVAGRGTHICPYCQRLQA